MKGERTEKNKKREREEEKNRAERREWKKTGRRWNHCATAGHH
jgi:hypothetical protein